MAENYVVELMKNLREGLETHNSSFLRTSIKCVGELEFE